MELELGAARARITGFDDAAAALALRSRLFRNGVADRDPFDRAARHLVVERQGKAVACARMRIHRGGTAQSGYTGQFYDLTAFDTAFPTALEVGRIGLAPDAQDPDLPRLLLGILARVARQDAADVLFGCTSFPADGGTVGLGRHVAATPWRPGCGRGDVIALPDRPGPIPPLLRLYLALGAVISDHAVRDPDLDTLHVFTALPMDTIPPNRARMLTGLLERAV
ncbi:MAG: GNAT family N-acyltransferase [Pseudomonadota bacterium]